MGKQLVKSSKLVGSGKPRMSKTHVTKTSPSYINPDTVKVGDVVEARFTNVAGWHRFPARIVRVNRNTVRVVRADGKPVWEGDSPDREFSIPKIGTENNGIFAITSNVRRFKPPAARDWDKQYAHTSAIHFAGDMERRGYLNISIVESELRPGSGVFVYDVYYD